MAGDPKNQNDDYTIEEKEGHPTLKPNLSQYNGSYQYQSASKQSDAEERSIYGLKNPIKKTVKQRQSHAPKREMGHELV